MVSTPLMIHPITYTRGASIQMALLIARATPSICTQQLNLSLGIILLLCDVFFHDSVEITFINYRSSLGAFGFFLEISAEQIKIEISVLDFRTRLKPIPRVFVSKSK
jgi:hypothetical protein